MTVETMEINLQDGDVTPSEFLDWCWTNNIQCYLDIIHSHYNDDCRYVLYYQPADEKRIVNKLFRSR